jgi:hypothetical protein
LKPVASFAANGAKVLSMNSLIPLAFAILLLSINLQAQQSDLAQHPASAQEAPTTQQPASALPPNSSQPQDMEEWLNIGKNEERVERLVSLGVEQEVAAEFTQTTEKSAKWLPIHTEPKQKNVMLFLPCFFDNAHLYLLAYKNKTWHITDFEKPDCHYDMSVSVEVAPIRNPAFDEVLMHHAGAGHGTGISVQDFEVFDIANGKFKTEVDTQEVLVESEYIGQSIRPHSHTQESFFVLVPIDLPTKFVPVEAAPN